jgi:hypothetical protein
MPFLSASLNLTLTLLALFVLIYPSPQSLLTVRCSLGHLRIPSSIFICLALCPSVYHSHAAWRGRTSRLAKAAKGTGRGRPRPLLPSNTVVIVPVLLFLARLRSCQLTRHRGAPCQSCDGKGWISSPITSSTPTPSQTLSSMCRPTHIGENL